MFLPVKADFKLPRFPWLTAVVCAVCFGIFLKQVGDWNQFEDALYGFCGESRSNITQMIFNEISDNSPAACIAVMYGIAASDDEQATIEKMVSEMRPLKSFSVDDSKFYVSDMLNEELRNYHLSVPEHPDEGLAYYTETWNPLTMIASAFAHGSWSHIIFNLFFFIAFAATIEVLIGPVAYVGLVLVVSLFTGVFSSVSAIASGSHFSTLGLSGVVMGMMGLFAYLLPKAKILCYYWFIIFFGSVAIPAWVLALWYIGGDIYALFASDDHGMVNVMAHVTGGIAGYLFGIIFLHKVRRQTRLMQQEADSKALRAKIA
ncbi:MAG: rhomboid family intramembrane serine protease [Proteobacteria bacterium]|nr:rhomboid family intramembrane serine protease [Pseudomonadota bacterium]